MSYVDGYLLVVKKKKLAAYKKMARLGGKVWTDHGALEYRECVLEDSKPPMVRSFVKLMKPKKGETVVFAYVLFKSRAHRDKVNKKAMADPRLNPAAMDPDVFNMKTMTWSGFETIVKF